MSSDISSELAGTSLELTDFVRPGDSIIWGQGAAEPLTLTEALVEQRAVLGGVNVFLGANFAGTIDPAHADHLNLTGLGGIGSNRSLAKAGVLDVVPCHVASIPRLIRSGHLPVDVAFVQVSLPGPEGGHSLGLTADFLLPAIERARVVIAEVNERVPFTFGDTIIDPSWIDHAVAASRPPITVPAPRISPVEERIAAHVKPLIEDGTTLQLGIGGVPQAIASNLSDCADLGVHSGMIGDWVVDLVEAGVVTNTRKGIDPGVTVTGSVLGSDRLYDFVADNAALSLRRLEYTHNLEVLRGVNRLLTINSAIEVDLTGQVNAETLAGRHVGAVGGQVDYVRAGSTLEGARSVIALPATARNGEVSRIVTSLGAGVATTPRSDVDLIVTEYGIADLRGMPLRKRAERLIAIADPRFRDDLSAELDHLC